MHLQKRLIIDVLKCTPQEAQEVEANISAFFPRFYWNSASSEQMAYVINETAKKLEFLKSDSPELKSAISNFFQENCGNLFGH